MRALSQMLGSFCVAIQVLNRLRSHIFVCSPKCLICSVEMLSRPTAFPGFRLCIAVSSSIIVNSLVKPGSVGYFRSSLAFCCSFYGLFHLAAVGGLLVQLCCCNYLGVA